MTLREWDKDLETASLEELNARLSALETLAKWKTFNKEFRWTGMSTLAIIIEAELRKRTDKPEYLRMI